MTTLKINTVLTLLFLTEIGQADPLDTWTLRYTVPPPSTVFRMFYGNKQFVAVGDSGTILTSADGVNWAQRQSGTINYLDDVAYGNGQFVAVGWGCGPNRCDGIIISSTDGVSWVLGQPVAGHPLSAIAYGNGQFVAAGDAILTSVDAVNWTERQLWDNTRAITYGNGQFVAVGGSGILTSVDGVKWVPPERGTTNDLVGVAYGKGMFVAVGGRYIDNKYRSVNTIVTSTDGVTWAQRQSGTEDGLFQSIAYGNGMFVAGGTGRIVTSADGVNWTQRQLYAYPITYGNGHFLVRSGDETILQSGSIIDLSIIRSASTGLPTLSLAGPTGLSYTIQSSTDLMSWQTLTNIIGVQPTNVAFDPLPTGSDRAFYRAYSQ